jgi:hypothetical protein
MKTAAKWTSGILLVIITTFLIWNYLQIKATTATVSKKLAATTIPSATFTEVPLPEVCSTILDQLRAADPFFDRCELVSDVSHTADPILVTDSFITGPADQSLAQIARRAELAAQVHHRTIFISIRSRDYRNSVEAWLDLVFRKDRTFL